jgi:hypothetical protein
MKSLTEFKQPIIEEESDYAKFDMLVRAGLANKAQLQRIHKILDKMKEDRPVFNNADRMILQNLFNKMVDLISNNKQIFQQTRRAVREELEESILDTSDYKTTKSGKKYKAHRIKIGDEQYGREEDEQQKEEVEVLHKVELDESLSQIEPPFVLVLKRKAIRLFPNDTRIALYYSDKINKYFSVPYSTDKNLDAPVQAESVENVELEEAVMDQLHKIVAAKQKQSVKFGNGQTQSVDHYTASAITQVHKALNDDNKKKFADMVHKSPAHLAKAADFAFSKVKK